MDANTDQHLLTQQSPTSWAFAYLDTQARACEIILGLVHQRTERLLNAPIELARIGQSYWSDAAGQYAGAANELMTVGTNLLGQSQKSLHS